MRINFKKGALYLIVIVLAATYQGCGEEAEKTQPDLISISVEPHDEWIAKGRTIQFKALGSFSDSSTRDITSDVIWSSSDTNVATIDANGLGTGVIMCLGSTTIIATTATIAGKAELRVGSICDFYAGDRRHPGDLSTIIFN